MIENDVSIPIIPDIDELIERIVFSEKEIDFIVGEQAKRAVKYIERFNMHELVYIVVKNGAKPYADKLKKQILEQLEIKNYKLDIIEDDITLSSYKGTKSGDIILIEDIKNDIKNKFILVVEDIEDSGKTLDFLYRHFSAKSPNWIRFSVFLKRRAGYSREITVDIGAYSTSNKWFIGFGLDYFGHYRELPYLAEIKDKYQQI